MDGDGPVLVPGTDYEEADPSGPAHFSLDVLSAGADSAQVRVRYGAGGRPDPSIRPWPGGDVWQSPDIEIRNEKSTADPAWRNVPWAGHTNQIVAKVTNSGDFVAKSVRVNLFVKDFAIGSAPETPIGFAVHELRNPDQRGGVLGGSVDTWRIQAEYLGTFGFADCWSREIWVSP